MIETKKLDYITKKTDYIEAMTKELVESLRGVYIDMVEAKNDGYMSLWNSSSRAKYKRLRVELTKELMNIQKELY